MNIFRASKIVIIDSLEEFEFQTGEVIQGLIEDELEKNNFPLRLERHSLDYAAQFEGVINLLVNDVKNGFPILHIEMHGDEKEGLIFKNGSNLPWADFVKILARLNRATEFNLVCTVATCYGASIFYDLCINFSAPCFALITPEKEVDPGTMLRGFHTLYSNFAASRDMSNAEGLLNQAVPVDGGWFQVDAVTCFYETLRSYVKTGTSIERIAERALSLKKDIYDRKSISITLKVAENIILSLIRDFVTYKYFEVFFMIKEIPNNRVRFEEVRKQAEEDLLPLIGNYSSIEEDE